MFTLNCINLGCTLKMIAGHSIDVHVPECVENGSDSPGQELHDVEDLGLIQDFQNQDDALLGWFQANPALWPLSLQEEREYETRFYGSDGGFGWDIDSEKTLLPEEREYLARRNLG